MTSVGRAEGLRPHPAGANGSPFGALRAIARRYPLVAYTLRRLAIGAALAFGVSVVVFLATQALPGDAASVILGQEATQESIAAVREQLNLDRPILVQYSSWITGFVRGDLGESFALRQPVGDLIARRAWNSAVIAGATLLIMAPLSLGLGVFSALRAGRPSDTVLSGLTLSAIALPEFVVGATLAAFIGVSLGLLPPVSLLPSGESPLAHIELLVLPVATLLITASGYATRMIRASMIEVMRSDYVSMARLLGIPERRVVWRHAIPNSLGPTVQVFALMTQWLVGGVVVVEVVFAYPGLGQTLVQAVASRDIPIVQATTMYIAGLYILITIAADVAVALLVPKLRTSP